MFVKEEFMPRLKAAIMPMHDEAEKSGLLSAIATGSCTLRDYKIALKRLYGFVAPAEALIASKLNTGTIDLDYQSMKRMPHLEKDLGYFGVSTSEVQMLPLCKSFPPVDNSDAALGILYLFEGSRIGGKILAKAIRDKFDLNNGQGCAYFGSNGLDVGPGWNSFRRKMESYVREHGDPQAIIFSAQAGFNSLNRWLTIDDAQYV